MTPVRNRVDPSGLERSAMAEAEDSVGCLMFLLAIALVLLLSFFCAGIALQRMGWAAVGVVYVATVVVLFLPVAAGGLTLDRGGTLLGLAWRVPVVWLVAVASITVLDLAGPPVVCTIGTLFVLTS